MKDIQIVDVTGFKLPKCDLTEEEFEQYCKRNAELQLRFYELCEDMDELRSFEEEHHIRWKEDKAKVADAFCLALQMTDNAGKSNHVSRMNYRKLDNGDEIVVPVLADGEEWYTCHVSGDSGTAMIIDMASQFVRKAW